MPQIMQFLNIVQKGGGVKPMLKKNIENSLLTIKVPNFAPQESPNLVTNFTLLASCQAKSQIPNSGPKALHF